LALDYGVAQAGQEIGDPGSRKNRNGELSRLAFVRVDQQNQEELKLQASADNALQKQICVSNVHCQGVVGLALHDSDCRLYI
jgi:hypothetical protein